ncbi:hypothetical protein [Actinacidiphila sp. ITFR-21]|uniref:hypothetical protein n=1 Tax=Actinacidiphila sp. ITFR-21 TaxID=3075199 RepID=UPI002889492D|nr:hypothetical protein [Streptomyces sp. ITFR-21]WNI17689.1 hypothetical protein RLT57_20580 [Streptomyces sp. ITFR-21]WNI17829.1 hypothetical protein RLT57_21295 [Streptomyces sp. ITFR-21]
MKYVDADMKEQAIRERSISRLAHVEEHAGEDGLGRFEIRKATGELWDAHEVRALQERGLWDVEWLEAEDEKHEGGWRILGLTEVGRNVLKKWRDRETA